MVFFSYNEVKTGEECEMGKLTAKGNVCRKFCVSEFIYAYRSGL